MRKGLLKARFLPLLRLGGVSLSENASPACGDEVPQLILLNAGKPDEHDGMIHIVIRDIVSFGIVGQKCIPLFKIGANDK